MRLPLPTDQEIEKGRTYAKTYERGNMAEILRAPFFGTRVRASDARWTVRTWKVECAKVECDIICTTVE